MSKKLSIYQILPILLILVVAIGFIIFVIYNHRLNDKFIKVNVNSTIIKRDNWQLRTSEFYLSNGLRIDSTYIDKFDLKVGDSISKKENNQSFEVYRKINDKYEFYKYYTVK